MKTKTKSKKKLPTFTISRRRWHRGREEYASQLYVPETRKMCCLGQIARQCGCAIDDIKSLPTPDDVDHAEVFIPIGLVDDEQGYFSNKQLAEDMMEVNDNEKIDDRQRERELRQLADRHFKLRFVP